MSRLVQAAVAAVIGDVSGHGIEPAITAFQAKYLLRVFLRQYRDPAQALAVLVPMAGYFAGVFDVEIAGTAADPTVAVAIPPPLMHSPIDDAAPDAPRRQATHFRDGHCGGLLCVSF